MNGTLSEKEMRQKFGVSKKPIRVVKLYRKGIEFDHAETAANPGTGAWIGITADGMLLQANTYSGNLGRNYVPQLYPMPGEKELTKRLKQYQPADVSIPGADCFEVVVAGKPDENPAPEQPAPETPAAPTAPATTEGDKAAEAMLETPAPAKEKKAKK